MYEIVNSSYAGVNATVKRESGIKNFILVSDTDGFIFLKNKAVFVIIKCEALILWGSLFIYGR